jgi:hypothetical protein
MKSNALVALLDLGWMGFWFLRQEYAGERQIAFEAPGI